MGSRQERREVGGGGGGGGGEIILVCMGESEGALPSAECTNRGMVFLGGCRPLKPITHYLAYGCCA